MARHDEHDRPDAALGLRHCVRCGAAQLPPLPTCRRCGHHDLAALAPAGGGVVVSHTTVRRRFSDDSPATPYTVLLVQLDEGPRLLGLLSGKPLPETGARVRLGEATGDDEYGPYFQLEGSGRG